MRRSASLPGLRNLVILASALTAFILLASTGALASGPMDPPAQQSDPNGGTGQTGTGSAGQPGGTGGTGSNSAPGQSAQSGGAANPAPKAAVDPAPATPKKAASSTPTHSTGTARTPVRSTQTSENAGGNIETIVELPQPTAKLEAGPAPTGMSSGEPTDSLIEVASTAQPGSFPYATVALGLGILALLVLLVPSIGGMPRPAVGSAADPA